MSVAYELPPRVRRVRSQAPAVVLSFPRPESVQESAEVGRPDIAYAAPSAAAPKSVETSAAARRSAIDGPGNGTALLAGALVSTAEVMPAPADDPRTLVDGPRTLVDAPRGPVACPSSSPVRGRSVGDLAGSDAHDGRLRLTARGRRLRALVCACALVVAGWITVSAIHSAVSSPLIPSSAPAVVQVHQGDTLWSIAARVAPRQDPRRVVDALRSANHLDSTMVRPGQRLRVPR